MEYTELTPYIDEMYRSKMLSRFMGKLDEALCDMEQTIAVQKAEIIELNKQIAQDMNHKVQAGWAMMGNVLKACISVPDMTEMGPAAAVMIERISYMTTIEQVQEYISWLKAEGRKQLQEQQ